MKVQVLKTFECSGQISPNSCHFWNNRSVFLQILHQSSGSWDITPLYFLAKIVHTLRSLSKYKFGEILYEQSKVWHLMGTLMGSFCPILLQFQLKKYRRVLSWHWTVIQSLKKNSLFDWNVTWEIGWILTWAMKNPKICTVMGYFSEKYVTFELKKYRRVVSWKMTYDFKNDIRNSVNFHTSIFNFVDFPQLVWSYPNGWNLESVFV